MVFCMVYFCSKVVVMQWCCNIAIMGMLMPCCLGQGWLYHLCLCGPPATLWAAYQLKHGWLCVVVMLTPSSLCVYMSSSYKPLSNGFAVLLLKVHTILLPTPSSLCVHVQQQPA